MALRSGRLVHQIIRAKSIEKDHTHIGNKETHEKMKNLKIFLII